MPFLADKSRRNLVVLGSTVCLLPKIAIAQSSRPQPLILGLVTSGSLYPMAVPFSSKGIDWANAVSGDAFTDEGLVKVDTILGATPDGEFYAYSSSGQFLEKYWGTDWERHNPSYGVGDSGFLTTFKESFPDTYLVSNQLFKPSFSAVTSKLNRAEILKLQPRFKRDVLSELAKEKIDLNAREMLAEADLSYTGNRIFLPSHKWTITTIKAKRVGDVNPSYLELTWIEAPNLATLRYVSQNIEESLSTVFKGVLPIPGQQFPLVFLGNYHMVGANYLLSWDVTDSSRTVILGGDSAC